MNTLGQLTQVKIQTLKNNIFVLADKDLMDFLELAGPTDTKTLRSYFNLDIPMGDFYVGYARYINKKT